MTKQIRKVRPTEQYPELMGLFVQLAIISRKISTPRLAELLGIKRQSFQAQVDKALKEQEGAK